MKNRGFTIIEVLAVVVILGILSSVATISVSRYRKEVRDNELVNLHATIEAAYDNYRSSVIMSGGTPKTVIDFSVDTDIVSKYFSDLTYSGNRLSASDLSNSKLEMKIKGELLNSASPYHAKYFKDYNDGKRDLVKDGTCLTESVIESINEKNEIVSKCDVSTGGLQPSKEEMLCVVLNVNGDKVIDDFNSNVTQRELCTYFVESE